MQPRCSICWTTVNLAKCSRKTAQTCCALFTVIGMTGTVRTAGTLRAYFFHRGRWARPDPGELTPRPNSISDEG